MSATPVPAGDANSQNHPARPRESQLRGAPREATARNLLLVAHRGPGGRRVMCAVARVALCAARLDARDSGGRFHGGPSSGVPAVLRDVRDLVERLVRERMARPSVGPWTPSGCSRRSPTPARRAGRDRRQPRALHPRAHGRRRVQRAAPGERPGHRARAGDARLLGRLGRARQRLAPIARPPTPRTRARAAGRGVVPAAARVAHARRKSAATTTASPTRACGRCATSRTRGPIFRSEDWRALRRGQPELRRRGVRGGRLGRPDRARAGLPLRARAAR